MTGIEIKATFIRDILTGILLYLVIVATMYFIPLIGAAAWLFLPLPVLFYRLKTGRQGGLIIMLATLAVLTLITQEFAIIFFYYGSLLITGFVLGECIETHLPIGKIMLFTTLSTFGVCLAGFFLYSAFQNMAVSQFISGYISDYHALSKAFISELETVYPEIDRQMFEKESSALLLAHPSLIIIFYLIMVWMNILAMRRILIKKGIMVKTIQNLNHWKAPDHLVFGLILVSVLIFFASGVVKIACLNALIVLLFVYFFQGIAVVSFLFEKKRTPFAIRFFFYFLMAILPQFLLLVIGCGLFDIWINFRKLDTASS